MDIFWSLMGGGWLDRALAKALSGFLAVDGMMRKSFSINKFDGFVESQKYPLSLERLCRNPNLSFRTHDSACGNLNIIKDLRDCFAHYIRSQRHCDTVSDGRGSG